MDKIQAARDVLELSLGSSGVYADLSQHDYQCWTRDFALYVQPALHLVPGGVEAGERHLRSLAVRQRGDGRVPAVFLDGLPGAAHLLWTEVQETILHGRPTTALWQLLKGRIGETAACDSELWLLHALAQIGPLPDDLEVARVKAFEYVRRNLLDKQDMVRGSDWRDTRDLVNQILLSNNAVWYAVLYDMNLRREAAQVRAQLRSRAGYTLCDYPGSGRFDPVGGALAVLCDVVSSDDLMDSGAKLCADFQSVDSPHGVTVRHRPSTRDLVESLIVGRTSGVLVRPAVVGLAALALWRIGTAESRALARTQRDKLLQLDGFHAWYDPTTGRGYGAAQQTAAAAMVLRVWETVKDKAQEMA